MKIWIDTETTGLFDRTLPADAEGQPRACSFCAILTDDAGAEQDMYYSPVLPDGWFVRGPAVAIHGLTMERLNAEGRPIKEVMASVLALYALADIVTGWGIDYDLKMMRAELRRLGHADLYNDKPKDDVMFRAMRYLQLKKFPSLHDASLALLGKPQPVPHNAVTDLRLVIDIWKLIRDRDNV